MEKDEAATVAADAKFAIDPAAPLSVQFYRYRTTTTATATYLDPFGF
jgi:hypothetical protein